MCMHTEKEADIRYISHLFSTTVLESRSLMEPGIHVSSSGQQGPRDSVCLLRAVISGAQVLPLCEY